MSEFISQRQHQSKKSIFVRCHQKLIMSSLTAIIIEDEFKAQSLLQNLLAEYCPEINIVGIAATSNEAKNLFDLKPDIVFLDIQIGEDNGFELLEGMNYSDCMLIITTAYDHYALEGFKHEAIDYILKPYSPNRIIKAVNRVKKQNRGKDLYKQLSSIISNGQQSHRTCKLSISTSEGIHIIDVDDIVRLEAQKAYCKIYLKNNGKILASKPMGDIEKKLPSGVFFKVHSGHIVKLSSVKQISNQDGGYILMCDDSKIPLARRRKQEFMAAIQA